jgi:monoterpene epsilon-lactone hydrolase
MSPAPPSARHDRGRDAPVKRLLGPVRDAASRTLLGPSLRLLRDRMNTLADYREFRLLLSQFDAKTVDDGIEAKVETVPLGDCTMTWVDVANARHDRVILYLHGGGFIMETPQMHAALVRRLCRGARARGLMVNYRLAPEHRYPAAADDCYAAYRYLLESGYAPGQIVIAGDSAGGNLTLSTLLRARDLGLPLPCAAVALSPLTDVTLTGDSISRNDGHDPVFTAAVVAKLAPLYLPSGVMPSDPYVSPLLGELTGLPPILLIVGSSELLLDDSVRFASKCPSAAVTVWHDMPHVFPLFPFLRETDDAINRISTFLDAHFGAVTKTPFEESEAPASAGGQSAAHHALRVPTLASFYLLLAVVAVLLGLAGAAFAPTIPGLAPQGLVATMRFGTAPGAEALLAAIAALAFIGVDGFRQGVSHRWLPVAGTLLFGIACGLPLYLFMRERCAGNQVASQLAGH